MNATPTCFRCHDEMPCGCNRPAVDPVQASVWTLEALALADQGEMSITESPPRDWRILALGGHAEIDESHGRSTLRITKRGRALARRAGLLEGSGR